MYNDDCYRGAFEERRKELNSNYLMFEKNGICVRDNEYKELFSNPHKYQSKLIKFWGYISGERKLITGVDLYTYDCIGNPVYAGTINIELDENTIATFPSKDLPNYVLGTYTDEWGSERIRKALFNDEIILTRKVYCGSGWIYGRYEGIKNGKPLIHAMIVELKNSRLDYTELFGSPN
ncbi:MAG: hypothetical protein J6A19_11375 [Oscillospiraceae bacterium]|nr:hypothetical protein [Oscillospiraceae bacterium]